MKKKIILIVCLLPFVAAAFFFLAKILILVAPYLAIVLSIYIATNFFYKVYALKKRYQQRKEFYEKRTNVNGRIKKFGIISDKFYP